MQLTKKITLVILFITITGCSSIKPLWEHAHAKKDQWLIDEANCKSRVKKTIQKQLELINDIQTIEPRVLNSQLSNELNAYMTKKTHQKKISACLRQLGYTQVKLK